jgi:hypothetical protein
LSHKDSSRRCDISLTKANPGKELLSMSKRHMPAHPRVQCLTEFVIGVL